MFNRPRWSASTRSGSGPDNDAMFTNIVAKLCKMPQSTKTHDVTFFLKSGKYEDSVITEMSDAHFTLANGATYTFTTPPTDEMKTIIRDSCTYKFNVYTFPTMPMVSKTGGARESYDIFEVLYNTHINRAINDQSKSTTEKLVDTKNFYFGSTVVSFLSYLKSQSIETYTYALTLCDFNCIASYLTLFQPGRYDKLFGDSIRKWRRTVDMDAIPSIGTYANYLSAVGVEIPTVQFNKTVVITDFTSGCAAYVAGGRTEDQVAPRFWFDLIRSMIAYHYFTGDMLSGKKLAVDYPHQYSSSVYSAVTSKILAGQIPDYIQVFLKGGNDNEESILLYWSGVADALSRAKSKKFSDKAFPYNHLISN